MLTGLDVSYWQGTINWQAVRNAGYRFAFARATQGTGYADPTFVNNVTCAQQAGILVGAYHFFQLAMPAKEQARFFLNKLVNVKLDLPAALDFEDSTTMTKAAAASVVKSWLDLVEQGTGRRPIIYTNANSWDTYIGAPVWVRDYQLWVANYTAAAEPYKPKCWTSWIFWQHSNTGQIPGISGNVDLNRCSLSEADLLELAGKTQQPVADEGEKPISQDQTLEERVSALEAALKTIKEALKAKGVIA
jgi:lysozyme